MALNETRFSSSAQKMSNLQKEHHMCSLRTMGKSLFEGGLSNLRKLSFEMGGPQQAQETQA
jgi:hypothetical protein